MGMISVSTSVILLVAILSGSRAEAEAAGSSPAVIAVKFHADWCGSCKAMGPVFEEMQAKFDTQPVLYVVLDHTREFNRQQSKYLATSLDLDKIWDENGGKTGFIMLIDAKTRKPIGTLTKDQNLKQMGAALLKAVAKASS